MDPSSCGSNFIRTMPFPFLSEANGLASRFRMVSPLRNSPNPDQISPNFPPNLSCIDPVFFLHHTQVDRLWSIWQDRNIDIRAKEYFGPTLDSPDGAKLDDVLEMGGLVPDGRVADYLDIREKHLCYRYQS